MHAYTAFWRSLSHVRRPFSFLKTSKNVFGQSSFPLPKCGPPCSPLIKSHPYGTGVAGEKKINEDDLLNTLRTRGLVADCTDDELGHIIKNNVLLLWMYV